ncbi:MAG: acetyl-CoA carboxylase carboxyltransferase subunit alpha [Epulopiscium sp.]|nr:acetyl-CoA carboxylase carboxyltransferase subunit alpha [Candidatus Epulonipiscium sp.]
MSRSSAWETVSIARRQDRPNAYYYINEIFDDFIELRGDRSFADDRAIIGGIARLDGIPVTVIGQNKGMDTKENIANNFAMPNPEGYRKALRLMKQAEKFKRPVICLIDTPGAYCGLGAEERGQGQAIARNLLEMSRLKTPIISGVIGEGGSGGALALGVADRIFMQENTIYSILSPEGFASILWKDSSMAPQAAEVMKITAKDLYNFNIIDRIIKEPIGGASENPKEAARLLEVYLKEEIIGLIQSPISEILKNRYNKFRKLGEFM